MRLMDTDRSVGEVTNVGNTEEITIENLALQGERAHQQHFGDRIRPLR